MLHFTFSDHQYTLEAIVPEGVYEIFLINGYNEFRVNFYNNLTYRGSRFDKDYNSIYDALTAANDHYVKFQTYPHQQNI